MFSTEEEEYSTFYGTMSQSQSPQGEDPFRITHWWSGNDNF